MTFSLPKTLMTLNDMTLNDPKNDDSAVSVPSVAV